MTVLQKIHCMLFLIPRVYALFPVELPKCLKLRQQRRRGWRQKQVRRDSTCSQASCASAHVPFWQIDTQRFKSNLASVYSRQRCAFSLKPRVRRLFFARRRTIEWENKSRFTRVRKIVLNAFRQAALIGHGIQVDWYRYRLVLVFGEVSRATVRQ